jgi:hypothetical protein
VRSSIVCVLHHYIIRVIKSRRIRWAGYIARKGGDEKYKILVGKPEGKRQLVRPRRRWEDNIRTDRRERGLEGANQIHVAEEKDRWFFL